MKFTLTSEQCRQVDRYAIEQLGIPGVVLMENAGRNAADLIDWWCRRRVGKDGGRASVSVLCGKGNNGGDGFVIARHLAMHGLDVGVDLLGDSAELSPDCSVNHAIVARMGIRISPLEDDGALAEAVPRWAASTAVVDALLGTGFAGEVREPMASVIQRINELNGPLVVAIDVPSGLNADTGEPGGIAVRAHRTITFLAAKQGFGTRSARAHVGRLSVAHIGAPLQMILNKLGLLAS